jgi:RHS repeat-associated protein
MEHPTGLQATFRYDDQKRLVRHTPMDGVEVRLMLDASGRTIERQRGRERMNYVHDAVGRVVRVERNDGTRDILQYDAWGREVAVTDARGSRREVQFDTESRILQTQTRDTTGKVPIEPRHIKYDTRGRPIAEGNVRIDYDPLGRIASVVDNMQRQTVYGYDALGRQTAQEQRASASESAVVHGNPATTDLLVARTQLLYRRQAGEPDGLVAPNGATTTTDRDDFGRTVRLSSADTGVTVSTHDLADRPVLTIDASGNRTEYRHDALGRLIHRKTSNPSRPDEVDEARWRYEGARLAESGNAHQTDLFQWDKAGKLVEQMTRLTAADGKGSDHVFVTKFLYDEAGKLSEKRLPDGLVLLHRYQHGQLSAMVLRYPNGKQQPILASIEESAALGWRKLAFGNGVVTTYHHDRSGHITGIDTVAHDRGANKATPLYEQRLEYDGAGRVVAIERNGQTERYAYDGLDRLTEVRAPHENRRFEYDLLGNRTAMWEIQLSAPATTPTQELRYQPQSNRLQRIVQSGRAVDWNYDGSGRPTNIGQRQYRHGLNGRLAEIWDGRHLLAGYRYNESGERILKVVDDRSTHFLYSDNRLSAEVDGQGRLVAHYLYLGHVPVAKVEARHDEEASGWTSVRPNFWQRSWSLLKRLAGSPVDDEPSSATHAVRLLYVHADHLGTPQAGTDNTRNVAWRMKHVAFGRAAQSDSNTSGHGMGLNLRLPGQYFDEETQWHYNYMRDYDPDLGRYVQSDPIGLAGGLNTYAYASNNPLSYIDPNGLQAVPGLPIPVPPAAIPGTSQNNGLVDATWRALQALGNAVNGCKCKPATAENVRPLLNASPMLTLQPTVSLNAIQSWVTEIEAGAPTPPIQVDGNVIVDGNHRYIAGLLCGKPVPIQPWTAPLTRPRMPLRNLEIQP